MPLFICPWDDEELHLHLFEFTGTEDKVSGRNLVTERFSNLTDTKWWLLSRGLRDIVEVDEDALRRLWTQVCETTLIFNGAEIGLE